MERIIIGNISKPQGIKGELKINSLTNDTDRFLQLKEIYLGIETSPRIIRGCRISCNNVFMFIDGIITRNDADKVRGANISIDKQNAINLKKGEYFIKEIIGCKMYNEQGEYLGTVKNIQQNGAADIFEVSGNTNFMLPFVIGIAEKIDVVNKKIIVNSTRFSEVVCYED